MSEMEQLKKEADAAYSRQRWEELSKYLDSLFDEIALRSKGVMRAMYVFLGSWLVWVVTDLMWFPDQIGPGIYVYLVGLLYMDYRYVQLARARAELRGAIRVMRILKLMDPPEPRGRKRTKRKHPFAGVVEAWNAAKAKARGAIWRPV